MTSGIYRITHVASGKSYVGSAVNISARWTGHRNRLRGGRHHSAHLQNAWNKYGETAFEFVVLENVEKVEYLIAREQYWIDVKGACDGGYNISPTAGSPLGVKHSAATKAKMSATRRGRKFSPAHCALISARVKEKGMAQCHTPDARAKAAASNRGKKLAPHVGMLRGLARRGVQFSLEHRAALSAALKGTKKRPRSADHLAKLALAMTGKKHSAESRRKMSESAKHRGAKQRDPMAAVAA